MEAQGFSRQLFAGDAKHRKKVEVYEEWMRRPAGMFVLAAEERIAQKFGISLSTVRRYIAEINLHGYQPRLKPRQGRAVYAWDSEALAFMKAFYLAAQREAGSCTMRNAYSKTREAAQSKGWRIGSEQSAYIHLRDVHSMLITYAKGGARALDNIFYIARDLSALAPMQVVVGDQHIFDWWVIHNGREIRPQCYLWLDMRTRLVYGIAFEPGAYSHRTVARALKMGILRFGRFNSTYNDNGSPEKSGKIDHLVDTLQSYGMSFQDDAEMYRTGGGDYAIEDEAGKVVATAASAAEWRRQNRRMYALVKNAKAKPIERFFRTLEVLLQDMCLPGYVRDIRASAAEDEEAARRLDWQRRNGFLLGYEEFIDKVKQAIVLYENRDHAGLGRPPLEELRYAREREGWEPSHIDENDVRYIFLEAENRIVKGNRVTIAGRNYEGPALTRDMVIENRNNLAGLSGKKVKIYYDPDDPDAGAWAIDPRDGQSIFLTPEKKLNPFNTGGLAAAIERKRGDMKAVSGTFRETAAAAGRALTSPEYKPLIEARAQTTKVIEEKTAAAASMSEEDFRSAIASRIIREEEAAPGRQTVYAAPRKRYQAILDTILKGENLSKEDMVFKVDYESRMGPIEKTRWDVYLKFNKGV